MPRSRRTPKERAEASVRSLVFRLTAARMRVAELESELAEVSAILSGAAGAVKRVLPPVLAVVAAEEPIGLPAELADEDDMGPGRFA